MAETINRYLTLCVWPIMDDYTAAHDGDHGVGFIKLFICTVSAYIHFNTVWH